MLFHLERDNQPDGDHFRDVQMLAGHAALSITQRYIEADVEAQRRIVDLI
jgi:integrase/recombinase XerD